MNQLIIDRLAAQSTDDILGVPVLDRSRFAKLIVRECISIAQDRAAFDWAPPNDINHIINEIKQHFGVE
jgi:hypothetical protein